MAQRNHPNFEERLTAAKSLLESRGLKANSYAPPLYRLFWKLGFPTPPPHLASFWTNCLLMGVPFGALFGIFVWLVVDLDGGAPPGLVWTIALLSGIGFGTAMAAYYRGDARKHGLPSWKDLPD